jgi:CBS domain-containing protein
MVGDGYAIQILRGHRISAVPVVDQAGRVTGVVSQAALLTKLTALALPADAVRLALRLRERAKAVATTADPLAFAVAVRSGIVTITGRADSREVALNLLGAVGNAEEWWGYATL